MVGACLGALAMTAGVVIAGAETALFLPSDLSALTAPTRCGNLRALSEGCTSSVVLRERLSAVRALKCPPEYLRSRFRNGDHEPGVVLETLSARPQPAEKRAHQKR